MLRRTVRSLYTNIPRASRTSVGDQVKPRQLIFERAKPVHMYANKEQGAANIFNIDRPEISWERAKITGRRLWSDRWAKYYFGTSIIFIFIGVYYSSMQYQLMESQHGLCGPKRKQYKSRLTVVLDVDETLISFGDKAYRLRGSVKPRPYLSELLDLCAKIDAEVILWSAGSDRYMRAVLMAIDPAGLRVDH